MLWVTEDPPQLGRGGSGIRQLHLLEALAAAFPTDVLIVGPVVDERVRAAAGEVIELPRRRATWTEHPIGRRALELAIAAGSPYPLPAYTLGPARRALAQALRGMHDGYDVICIEHEGLAPVIPAVHSGKWVITLHLLFSGMISDELARRPERRQRLFLECDRRKARRMERRIVRSYDQVVVCSDDDAGLLSEIGGGAAGKVAVIPNGVDLSFFKPTAPPAEPRVLFPGSFDFSPNVDGAKWFCKDVWPRVREAIPDATLELVGRAPVAEVRALQDLPGVSVHADVPSIEPFYERARLVVVPLRIGTGTRLKALEAMAAARPIVGTTVGLAGLGVRDGVQALVADDAAAFAVAVTRLLEDDDLADRLGRAGRAHVEERFGWDRIGKDYVDLVSRLVGAPTGPRLTAARSGTAQRP